MPPSGPERLTGVIDRDDDGRWRRGQARDDHWRIGLGEWALLKRAGNARHLDHEGSILTAGATNSIHLATVSDRRAQEQGIRTQPRRASHRPTLSQQSAGL